MAAYSVLMCFAAIGWIGRLGPAVYFPLFASLISVTFVFSGANAVAQLCIFAAIGFVFGLMIKNAWKKRVTAHQLEAAETTSSPRESDARMTQEDFEARKVNRV